MRALPGGNVALVCAAVRAGRPVVVKTNPRGSPDDALLASEAATLGFWRPTGAAIELLDQRDDGFTLLLEQAWPGHPLLHARVSWEDKLAELGRLARRLHAAGPPPADALPMRAYAASWRDAAPSDAELDDLLSPSPDDVLVHGDLHPGNALRTGDAWKVIDPHGARGDRHADVWALICPEAPPLPDEPARARRTARGLVAVYARAAGLDPDRAAAWTRLRALVEAGSCEARANPAWARRLRATAAALSTD